MATATEELDDTELTEDSQEQEPEASAPAEIPPAPPVDAAAHIREHYEQIREKEREVYALEGEYNDAKEEAAGAKKAFDAADKELRNLIARGPDRQKKLPLEDAAELRRPKRIKLLVDLDGTTMKVGYEPPFEIDLDGEVVVLWNDGTADRSVLLEADEFEVIEWENGDEGEQAEAKENDAWRSAPFTELGLTQKQNELFEAAGVTTIGGLEDLRARMANGDYTAQWPKGIGPAKVTDIENRVIDWLDKNRDKFGEPLTVAEAATNEDDVINGDFEVVPEPEEAEAVHANGNGKAKKSKKSK